MYTYLYIHIYPHIYIYLYTHKHMYIYAYMHIYNCVRLRVSACSFRSALRTAALSATRCRSSALRTGQWQAQPHMRNRMRTPQGILEYAGNSRHSQ